MHNTRKPRWPLLPLPMLEAALPPLLIWLLPPQLLMLLLMLLMLLLLLVMLESVLLLESVLKKALLPRAHETVFRGCILMHRRSPLPAWAVLAGRQRGGGSRASPRVSHRGSLAQADMAAAGALGHCGGARGAEQGSHCCVLWADQNFQCRRWRVRQWPKWGAWHGLARSERRVGSVVSVSATTPRRGI